MSEVIAACTRPMTWERFQVLLPELSGALIGVVVALAILAFVALLVRGKPKPATGDQLKRNRTTAVALLLTSFIWLPLLGYIVYLARNEILFRLCQVAH